MVKLLKKYRVESSQPPQKGRQSFFFVIRMKIKFSNACLDSGYQNILLLMGKNMCSADYNQYTVQKSDHQISNLLENPSSLLSLLMQKTGMII